MFNLLQAVMLVHRYATEGFYLDPSVLEIQGPLNLLCLCREHSTRTP